MKKTLSIVLICGLLISLGGVSVFAENLPNTNNPNKYLSKTYYHYLDGDQVIRVVFDIRCFDTYIESINQIKIPASAGYPATDGYQYNYRTSVLVYVRLQNLTDNTLLTDKASYVLSSAFNMQQYGNTGSTYQSGYDIYFDSIKYLVNCNVDSYGQYLYILPENDHFYSTGMVLAPNEIYTMSFQFDVVSQIERSTYLEDTEMQLDIVGAALRDWESLSATIIDDSVNMGESYQINKISNNVQSILDQYTANAQNAQAVTDGTQTNEQTISYIGTNEDTWFTQNDNALQATGITNFNYTPTVMSGMSVISDQFNRLWLAVGDWNFIYTFSMMLGLVVLILRHNPQRKKSSSSGSGGGKSNAASS